MADWDVTYVNDLPDSCFAAVEPGGTKDDGGRTVPRSLRHLPYKDASGAVDKPHLRNALARIGQTDLPAAIKAKAQAKLDAAAKAAGIGDKAFRDLGELKAEPFDSGQLDNWLAGKMPRRLLAVPFGGPIPAPNAPLGVDIDGEWFSEHTDLYGGYKALLASRERLVDWHHDHDPLGVMKGAILGRLVLDEGPENGGWWADFWAKAGEQRLKLVAALEKRGSHLYGSAQAAKGSVVVDEHTGEIMVWPMIREAISTSPQNTLAVMPSLKALLGGAYNLDTVSASALRAYALGGDLEVSLRAASERGTGEARSGLAVPLEEVIGQVAAFIATRRLRT